MGYVCPVCETPHQDAEHLANHLAFTAMLHGDDHEAWLAEVAPDWASGSPSELADAVAREAEATEYDAVFEDTVGGTGPADHDHDPGRDPTGPADVDVAAAGRRGTGELDAEAREAVAEARRMTREMLDGRDGVGEDDDEAGEDDDGAGEDDDEAGEDDDGASGDDPGADR
jgi:hypothetical protein